MVEILMSNMMTTVNNTVFNTGNLLIQYITGVSITHMHTHKHRKVTI